MKKRMNDSSRAVELFVKAGLIAALAAAVLAPTTINVSGSEAIPRAEHAWPMLKRTSKDALPLPPIPYLETMPWLVREPQASGFKTDRLLGPKFELLRQEVAGPRDGGLPLLSHDQALNISSNG